MATLKISQLTAAAAATGTQELEVNESGTSKKITGAQLAAYIEGEVSSSPTFTGQSSFPDGTAAAPSITNTGDTNTGIFYPAEDTVAISTGGTERMRIDASGNVGIGTNSPFTGTTSFAIGKDPTIVNDGSFFGGGLYYDAGWRNTVASQGGWALRNTGGVFTIFTGPANGAVGSTISASERMRIGSAGQLGLSGANYGTSGQVLTSQGASSAPIWSTVITVSTVAPGSPAVGALWVDTN